VVIMAIPFALFGAWSILLMRGLNNDLYFQISLITLLGLSAKNSILITEFAIEHWRAVTSTVDSALIAARQRFRPIIMTSLAFICPVFFDMNFKLLNNQWHLFYNKIIQE
jgi:multidrug efflux pump subunit AcrB